jgi:hypothetical protein
VLKFKIPDLRFIKLILAADSTLGFWAWSLELGTWDMGLGI